MISVVEIMNSAQKWHFIGTIKGDTADNIGMNPKYNFCGDGKLDKNEVGMSTLIYCQKIN